jgi:hypothetical protein
MGKFRKCSNNHTSDIGRSDARYDIAFKRVKGLRGSIYILVYVLNALLIISSCIHTQHADSTIFLGPSLPLSLGIGTCMVYLFWKKYFFGSDWEEKKMQEFMDRTKNKWE